MEVKEISWVRLGHNHSFFFFLCFFLKNVFRNQSQDFASLGLFSSFYTLGEQQRFKCSFQGSQGWVEANALLNPWQLLFQLPRKGNQQGHNRNCLLLPCNITVLYFIETHFLHCSLSGPSALRDSHPRLHPDLNINTTSLPSLMCSLATISFLIC